MSLISEAVHSYGSRDLSCFVNNRDIPRHRWLDFKEGFSAELVRVAIEESSKVSPRLLDPFSGSGTTVVEASRMGCWSTAIEVNPFLFDVSAAKCHPQLHDVSSLFAWRDQAVERQPSEVRSELEGQSTFTESDTTDKWLFNRSVLRGYSALAEQVSALEASWAKAMKVAALSALMATANAKRDGKCVRYKKDWKATGYSSADFREAFRKVSSEIITDLQADPLKGKLPVLLHGDARSVLKRLRTASHDLVVTSPPYLNSFDYSDVYRPELFAGKYVRTNDELRAVRRRTLRSHVQVNRIYARTCPISALEPIIAELAHKSLWNKRLPSMITSYFWDMKSILRELYRVIRSGGSAWIVVSTSAYGGVQIPVDLVLADVGEQCGWKLRGVYVLRRLRASGQHWAHHSDDKKLPLRESLLILDRP